MGLVSKTSPSTSHSLDTTLNSSQVAGTLPLTTRMWTSISIVFWTSRSVPVSKLKFRLSETVGVYQAMLTLGFSTVLSVRDLALFAPEELILLFGNADEDWSRESEFFSNPELMPALEQSLKADHGYNSDSRAVKNLLDTMASYDKPTRREFLQL